MRLPWPFGRAQRSPSPSSAGDGATAAWGPDGASAPPPERASGDAWRRLPPLAETVGPPPLVAPNRPFAAALASNEPPAPILAPLSHGRSLEAPKGLVSGIARPTATVSGPSLPTPVQRAPLGRRGGAEDAEAWPGSAAADGAPEVPGSASPRAFGAAASGPAPELPAAPIRHLEPVTASGTPGGALTQAPEPARRAPLVGLVGQPRERAARGPATAAAAAGVQRSPATSERPAPPVVGPPAAPAAPPTPPRPAASMAGAPRLTIGQARRLGLGAPVAGGPVTGAGPMHGRGPAGGDGAAAARPTAGSHAGATGVQRAPQEGAPELPLAGRHDPPAGPGLGPTPADGGGPAMAAPEPASVPAPVAARPIAPAAQRSPALGAVPIISAKPLRSGVQRAPVSVSLPQRSPADQAQGAAMAPAAPIGGAGSVKVHRDGQAASLSSALDARSFTHGGEIYLPAAHGPLSSGTGRALLAHELTHVTQQRRLGSSLPPEHSSHGKSLEAEAVAAERAPELILATGRDREPAPMTAAALPSSGPESAPAAGPGPQRAPAGEERSNKLEMGPVTLLSGGSEDPKPVATTRQGKSSHSHSEQELEVLAHQLYHRIGRHLRRELLVDRERVGFALDLP